jgi:hypothetical protein
MAWNSIPTQGVFIDSSFELAGLYIQNGAKVTEFEVFCAYQVSAYT